MAIKRDSLQGVMAATGLLVLIFDSGLALESARAGTELCIKTVIPSLFPFFVLTISLTEVLQERISYPIQLAARFLKIPESAISVLIPSFLGGYPVGAKCVGALYQKKQVSKHEAERLLGFCSNCGPSFLFGMISCFFPQKKTIWILWMIHIISAVMTALVMPKKISEFHDPRLSEPAEKNSIIHSSAKAMGQVCCWVILFGIIVSFLRKWFLWMLPTWMQVFITGILELTNGCCMLPAIPDESLRFILCSCMIAFGGACVILQTASVTEGLSLCGYLKGKLLQTAFSFLLSCGIMLHKELVLTAVVAIWIIIIRKLQNRSGNPRAVPV